MNNEKNLISMNFYFFYEDPEFFTRQVTYCADSVELCVIIYQFDQSIHLSPIDTPKSFAVQEGLFHFFQDKLRDLHGSPFYITSTSNQYPYMTDLFDVEFVGTMADYLYAISTLPRTQRWLCSKTIGEKWQIYNFNLDSNISPDLQFSYLCGRRISHRGKNLLFSHMTWLYFIHIGTFSISF